MAITFQRSTEIIVNVLFCLHSARRAQVSTNNFRSNPDNQGTLLVQCQDVTEAPTFPDEDGMEVQACSEGEFRCKDGACISGVSRCNGTAECLDGSDETFVLCRKQQCINGQFQCAYGACVRGAACDGVQDCADNSDERLTRCLPASDRTTCDSVTTKDGQFKITCRIQTECENGQLLEEADKCNGRVDCADATDETIERCAEVKCASDTFRCAYGGCAHKYAECNGIADCADGSDESDELCGRIQPITPKPVEEVTTLGPFVTTCILPPQPDYGAYVLSSGDDTAVPGDSFDIAFLNYTCKTPYKLLGKQLVSCFKGIWSSNFPSCKLYCRLYRHPSVRYRCLLSGSRSLEGSRLCNDEEPSGTTVKPVCRSPNYYSPVTLLMMHCERGQWDYVAICTPECGRMTPKGTKLVAGGRVAERDELPWHVGIYTKLTSPYSQICGGSILNTKIVISAAHCFWSNQNRLPAKNYAIAAGKLYRDWDHPEDVAAQQRDVIDVKIPARYQGESANFQADIALVVLLLGLQYSVHVRPVCIDFEYEFDARQLQPGNKGKVSGWGLTSEDGDPSPILKAVEIPYVSIDKCIAETPLEYKEYITSDKICAGYGNGTSVCKGDSGGGLSFPESERGVLRHYLRGVVSTAPRSGHRCNTLAVTSFTHLITHQHFIKSHFTSFSENGFRFFNPRGVVV